MPIATGAVAPARVGSFNEGLQAAQAIQNVPVAAAQRQASIAQAGLTEAQSKQQQALLAALQQKLPPGVTSFDLAMIEYYFKETGGVPVGADGKVDLTKIRSQLEQAANLKQQAAVQAAEQAGVKIEKTTIEDPDGNVYDAVQAFKLDATGNFRPLGQPTRLGLNEDATIKRAAIRSGNVMDIGGGGGTGMGGIGVPGLGGAGKQPTQEQIRATEFAKRLLSEEVKVQNLASKGFNPAKPGMRNEIAWALGGDQDTKLKQVAFQSIATPEYKQFTNAARAWINAGLRNESGAALGDKEIARFAVTYFALPGDDPVTVEDKRQRREVLRKAMVDAAGSLNTRTLYDFEQKIRSDPANAALFKNVQPTVTKPVSPAGQEATTEETETPSYTTPIPTPVAPPVRPQVSFKDAFTTGLTAGFVVPGNSIPAGIANALPIPITPQGDLWQLPTTQNLLVNPNQMPTLQQPVIVPTVQPNLFAPTVPKKPLPTWNISPQ